MNIAEGATIAALLEGRDVAVVNSCAVTAAAEKQSRAALRRLRRERPGAELVATGCAAARLGGLADRVVPNVAKLTPASWHTGGATPIATSGGARAFVGVQDGCDHDCTFCVTTQARGASRSVPVAAVVAHVAALVAAGRREVVLSGIDLSGYGRDRGTSLAVLVEAILRQTALPRLRLSSLDASEVDDALLELLVEPRVMPHLHLSLQSGDDLTLKRMKRRHSRAQAVSLVARVKARREVAIGADLIAGFPTEDAAAFAGTLALLEDCDIVHAHVFPYSPRPDTAAARMPQVAPEMARARAAEVRAAAAARHAAWLAQQIGDVVDVVVEKPGTCGHAPNFANVGIQAAEVGAIVPVRIVAASATQLTGVAA